MNESATTAVNAKVSVAATKAWPASAKVTYASDKTDIATVDAATGEVTGVKAGEATITATLVCGTITKTASTKVTVKNYVFESVVPKKVNTLEATILGITKDIKTTDIRVENAETKVVYPVQSVTPDAKDPTKVTITLFSELKDAKNYDVTLDGVTKSFKASDGAVADISVNPVTIPYATETEISLVAKDAQGIILKELAYGTGDINYDFTINANGNGYTNGSKLYLNKIGDTATAEITYKTGKYNQNGQPDGNIGPNKVTITAAAQSEISSFDVRIDSAGKSYDKAAANKKIAVGETKTAYLMIKNADGKEIADYGKYSFETSDKSALMIGSSKLTNKTTTLTALKAGTVYILIKDAQGAVVGSVDVDVVAERTPAVLELDKYSVTVSNALTGDSKTVKATVKDQYGNYDGTVVKIECLTAPTTDVKNAANNEGTKSNYYTQSGNTITFKNGVEAGNYVYKIYCTNKYGKEVAARTINVSVKDVTGDQNPTSWRVDVVNDGVDVRVDNDHKSTQTVKVSLIGMKDGVDVKREDSVKYTVKNSNGAAIITENALPATSAISSSAIRVDSTTGAGLEIDVLSVAGGKATKNLTAGTYTVTATKTMSNGQKVEITTSFTIKDSQAKPTVEVKENAVYPSSITDALKQALVVRYGDKAYTNNANVSPRDVLTIAKVEGRKNDGDIFKTDVSVTSGNYFTVSKLVVTIDVATGITMDVEVAVPGVITIK